MVTLDRIDTAIVAAAKTGSALPSPSIIFGALSDASIISAEVIEKCSPATIPVDIRNNLLRLQCAVSNLAASLKYYARLTVR